MKLDGTCFNLIQTAIYNAKDTSTYYTEMRIAQEKCQRGKNPHFCKLAETMGNNMELTQTELDRNMARFNSSCVAHSKIEDFGGD